MPPPQEQQSRLVKSPRQLPPSRVGPQSLGRMGEHCGAICCIPAAVPPGNACRKPQNVLAMVQASLAEIGGEAACQAGGGHHGVDCRMQRNGSARSEWRAAFRRGGLFEQGSTGAGHYERLAHGVQRCWGRAELAPITAHVPVDLAISFPKVFAASPDCVLVTPQTNVPGVFVTAVGASGVSPTGMTLHLMRGDLTPTWLWWQATGTWV